MDDLDPEVQNRISRRRMIKRLGAATAVAWTAPVLSTLGGSPALAQPRYCTDCATPAGDPCNNQPSCGCDGQGTNPCVNACGCLPTFEGPCGCHSCVFCDTAGGVDQTPPCPNGVGDCPTGWICAISCCSADATDFQCLPGCGAGVNPDPCTPGLAGAATRGGRTSMG